MQGENRTQWQGSGGVPRYAPSGGNPSDGGVPCASCGMPIAANAAFCSFCGASTAQNQPANTCPYCGGELIPNARFCADCGQDLMPRIAEAVPQASNAVAANGTTGVRRTAKKKRSKSWIVLSVIALVIAASVVWAVLRRNRIVNEAIESANQLAQKKQWSEALDILEDYRQDEKVVDLYKELQARFGDYAIERAKTVYDADPFLSIELLEKAHRYLPDNDEIEELLAEYEWDDILYEDDEYCIVRKNVETYESYDICVGLWEVKKRKWSARPSSDFVLAKLIQDREGQTTYLGSKLTISSDNYAYLNDGVFVGSIGLHVLMPNGQRRSIGGCRSLGDGGLPVYFYNAESGASTIFDATDLSLCSNGDMLMYNSQRYGSSFYRVNKDGNVTELPVGYSSWYDGPRFSGYSDGLFFVNGCFYDISGKMKINLEAYALTETPYFKNGQCVIRFTNDKGTEYSATIDKTGAFIIDPQIVTEE